MISCKLIKVHMVISCEFDGHEMTGSSGSKVDMQREQLQSPLRRKQKMLGSIS